MITRRRATRPDGARLPSPRRRRRTVEHGVTALSGILVAATLTLGAQSAPRTADLVLAATGPCATDARSVACENTKAGTPRAQWDDHYGAGAESIQGFSTAISVNVGERVDFKVDTDATDYDIEIYRTGYYGGDGARKLADVTPSVSLPQNQPNCITEAATELYDCGNWAVSASWNVPSTAVSGVYIARLHRADTDESSHITFIVRDDARASDVVFQTADTTWQAYNDYGGSNFYWGGANGRAFKLSYNRPVLTRGGTGGRDFYFANEYPMVRFLEKNGYDVTYVSGVDVHRDAGLLLDHKTYLSVGHDEYWSGPQRQHVEAARDAGVNLQFLSGNEMYWRTRFEPSADSSRTPLRTLVSYKETWGNSKIDPSPEWTGTWRDPRFAAQADGGGLPENGLIGTQYMVNDDDLAVTVSAEEGKLRLWRNTSLASLPAGTSRALAPHTIGYESNEDVDNGHRPAGLVRLSTTTGPTPQYLQDFGNTVAPGTTTHHLTMYRAASGALVFSAGSVQWTWGLDEVHDSPYADEPADPRMQQAQVNLFADMGVQPTTLDPALVATNASTDTTGPAVTVTAPAAGSTQPNGSRVTVTGTATDAGGRVAGVEVSTDGGTSWHPATGTTAWTYSYVQHGAGSTPIKVRATDDSLNTGAVVTRSVQVTCPCSVFGAEVPAIPAADDGSAAELGLRFTPVADGYVSGVRFYKGTGNGGTHTGSLWSATGQRLAQVTFQGESATGWQSAQFSNPVAVSAGQTYVVSYTAPQGRYSVQLDAFAAAGLEAHPLRVAGGFGATPAGVYANAGQFPVLSHRSANYYVDVLFTTVDESPLTVMYRTPLPDSSSVPATTTVTGTFSKPTATRSITLTAGGATVPGTTSYDAATRRITFTPSAALAPGAVHQVSVQGTDSLGAPVSGGGTWSFRTADAPSTPGVCPCSLFDDSATPTVLDANDNVAVTLGVRFSPAVDGTVSSVRFYKGPDNVGSHTGTLWAADGTVLATGTFGSESTTGWQTLTFAEPVPVRKDVEYYASYRTTVGHYSVNPSQFAASDLSRGPLRVAADSGAYTYGTGFPGARSSSNYLVDVVFQRAPSPLSVLGRSPQAGAVEVKRDSTVVLELSTPVQPGPELTLSAGGTPVPGTVQLSAGGTQVVFTPSSALPAGAEVTATLSGVTSTEGVSLPTQSWSFQVRSGTQAPEQTLLGTLVPATTSAADGDAIELGTAFTPTKAGRVTGIRFYKGSGNTGVHEGSLWTESGTKLAGVRFVGESADGWQTAMLAAPVEVAAGTTYVVSYHAPAGHYSVTGGYFSDPRVSGDLTAASGPNGRYRYGVGGGFPTSSWNASNYFVDVVFEKAPTALTVASRTPAPGATGVDVDTTPRITFSDAIAAGGWSMTASRPGGAVTGTAALSEDGRTLTFAPAQALPTGTTVTVTVSGVASQDGVPLAAQTWSFTTEEASSPGTSLFSGLTPANASVSDGDAVELGTAFTPQADGRITAVRFFKGTGNTGPHTGSVWSSTGTRLGTVTFTDETASGWQQQALDTAVPVAAGQTYVVSYYAPHGHYSVTGAFFGEPWVSGGLTAPSGDNGRYRYGAGGGFPTSSWNASNYFVDVVYKP